MQVQNQAPTILYIQFGLNDCNTWPSDRGAPRVSLGAFRGNLLEMIERAFRFGVAWIIVGTNHPSVRRAPIARESSIGYDEASRLYNSEVRNLLSVSAASPEGRLFLAENESTAIPDGHHLLEDGVHLSPRGHQEYFTRLSPIFEDLLLRSLKNREPD